MLFRSFQMQDAGVRNFVLCGEEAWEKGTHFFKELDHVVRIDGQTGAQSEDTDLLSLEELVEKGQKLNEDNPQMFETILSDASPDDLITIIYTSGSTGTPKGVELTHYNLVAQVMAAGDLIPRSFGIERALSVLPTAHIFERTLTLFYIASDISLYFVDDMLRTADCEIGRAHV